MRSRCEKVSPCERDLLNRLRSSGRVPGELSDACAELVAGPVGDVGHRSPHDIAPRDSVSSNFSTDQEGDHFHALPMPARSLFAPLGPVDALLAKPSENGFFGRHFSRAPACLHKNGVRRLRRDRGPAPEPDGSPARLIRAGCSGSGDGLCGRLHDCGYAEDRGPAVGGDRFFLPSLAQLIESPDQGLGSFKIHAHHHQNLPRDTIRR